MKPTPSTASHMITDHSRYKSTLLAKITFQSLVSSALGFELNLIAFGSFEKKRDTNASNTVCSMKPNNWKKRIA